MLARNNVTIDYLISELSAINPYENLLSLLEERGSNNEYRYKVIKYSILAIANGQVHNYKEALKSINQFIFCELEEVKVRVSIKLLHAILSKYKYFLERPLLCFANYLRTYIRDNIMDYVGKHNDKVISKISSGKLYELSSKYTLSDFIESVKILEEKGPFRTIHQAKGDEFENVLLVFSDYGKKTAEQIMVDFMLNPNLEDEEHRIYYVALSRARDRLFISIPTLSETNEREITNNYKVKIKRLTNK